MGQVSGGKYLARALLSVGDLVEVGANGNTKRDITFVIQPDQGDASGQRVTWAAFFSDKSIERTMEALLLCGCTFPGGDVDNFTGIDSNIVEVEVEVHQRYGPQVKWVNDPRGRGKPLASDAKATVKAKAKAALDLARKNVDMAKAPPSTDDIGF